MNIVSINSFMDYLCVVLLLSIIIKLIDIFVEEKQYKFMFGFLLGILVGVAAFLWFEVFCCCHCSK